MGTKNINRNFALCEGPVAYIVTIHYNNWRIWRGPAEIKAVLQFGAGNPILISHYESLVEVYGAELIAGIFDSLYGIKVSPLLKDKKYLRRPGSNDIIYKKR